MSVKNETKKASLAAPKKIYPYPHQDKSIDDPAYDPRSATNTSLTYNQVNFVQSKAATSAVESEAKEISKIEQDIEKKEQKLTQKLMQIEKEI